MDMLCKASLLLLAVLLLAIAARQPQCQSQVDTGSVSVAAAPASAEDIAPASAFDDEQHTTFSGQITDYGYSGRTGSLSFLLRPGPTACAIDLSQNDLGGFSHTGGIATGAQ
jgi:hypothetical protein